MANHLVLEDATSVVAAWIQATKALDAAKKPVYNLVYTINQPATMLASDDAVIKILNEFATKNGFHTTDTVANTIFPLDTFRAKFSQGADEFYDYYLDTVLPRVRKKWGTYFERMISRQNDDKTPMIKGNRRLNPLEILTEKLKRRVDDPPKTTTHYEIPLGDVALDIATYDPLLDGNYQIGGPCLSHVSFKIERDNTLRLSAFYRSHWYIERALGNLIGLARLQWFVAQGAGAKVGPLTIVAAEAVLDLTRKNRTAADTRAMLTSCWNAAGGI